MAIEGATDRSTGAPAIEHDWQRRAIAFLASTCSAEQLASFLPHPFAVAWCRSNGQPDSCVPGTATEIAEALVLLHDTDLLANAMDLRHKIAADFSMARLERFRAGSRAARTFMRRAGLPLELVGEAGPERPPAVVTISSPRALPELVDYQLTGKAQIVAIMLDALRAIYSVPTGGGKTRTAWEAV